MRSLISASLGSASGLRHVRHRHLVVEARLVGVERHRHGEDRLPVLDRDHAPGGEALAVADAVDLVDDRHLGIAGQQEIGVQGMRRRGRRRCGWRRPAPGRSPGRRTRAASRPAGCGRETGSPRAARGRGWRAGPGRRRSWQRGGSWRSDILPRMAKTKRPAKRARPEHADVLIGGGGFAGLALAIALRQGLGDPFSVAVADPALGQSHSGDARASAIAAAARRLFETIGVWDAGRRRRAADPRHGGHRFQAARTRCGRCSSPSPARSSRASRSPT